MSKPVKSVFDSDRDVDGVFATLTSREWVATKAQRFSDGSRLERHDARPDGGVSLTVSRELPDGVPGFLERFLPSDGRVTESFDWDAPAGDGSRHGCWSADIPGAPARLAGTLRLEPIPGGSRYTIEGQVKVSVPLVGGRAESFIASMVERLAAKEHELLLTT
jgi:hypothetical protein